MTNEDPRDLCQGSYDVTVTDANGCIEVLSGINVNAAAFQIAMTAKTDVTCFGDNNGTATFNVLGGCAPFTFRDSRGGQPIVSLLPEATFTGYSAGGLQHNGNRLCRSNAYLQFYHWATYGDSDNRRRCNSRYEHERSGNVQRSIKISVAGGNGPYSFVWNNGSTAEDPSGLCDDLSPYSVVVTDANGCTATLNNIALPPSISINTRIKDVSCFGDNNGEMRLKLSVKMGHLEWSGRMALKVHPEQGLQPGSILLKSLTGKTIWFSQEQE